MEKTAGHLAYSELQRAANRSGQSRWRRIGTRSLSLTGFIVSNTLPIFAVFYFDWSVFDLVIIYWMESLILGFYTVMKMLYVDTANVYSDIEVFKAIPFFTAVYIGLCYVIGLGILKVFNQLPALSGDEPFPQLIFAKRLLEYSIINRKWIWIPIFISYGVSFVSDYMKGGQYFRANLGKLMILPIVRSITLVVMFYCVLCNTDNLWTVSTLMKMICLKIVFDLFFDFLGRRKAVL